MNFSLVFIIGLILAFFPFLAVYSAWKDWVAFFLGLILLFISIISFFRNGNGENGKK